MAIRNQRPFTFRPRGLSDAIDGTNIFPGPMKVLRNLIPSPDTPGLFVPRAASLLASNFSTNAQVLTPGNVSALLMVGDIAYGMIAELHAGGNNGKDVPFAYNVVTQTFLTITLTGAPGTLPTTQATSGDWTPPIMAAVGDYIVITHPGYSGGGGAFFGWLNLANPAVPVYDAGNTATNPLPSVPVSVAQMAGSAFYACGTEVVISDALNPLSVTNATQAVGMGNGLAVTALGALPLNSSQLGGMVQSIIAFQGDANMVQISGNVFATPSTLQTNNIGVGVGTLSPLTISETPLGLAFVAPDGLRIINFLAIVSDPIGANGAGVNVPFLNALHPSRTCAAFNQNVMRISVQNNAAVGQPFQEYWYDFHLKVWTGPHDFPCALIQPYQGYPDHGFLTVPVAAPSSLFTSTVGSTASDTFIESGNQMTWSWQSCLLPDNQAMAMVSVVESTLGMALPATQAVAVIAFDEAGNILDQVQIQGSGMPSPVWGTAVWGSFTWGAGANYYAQRRVAWTNPLVFKQMSLAVNGNSVLGFEIGNFYLRHEILGYMLETG